MSKIDDTSALGVFREAARKLKEDGLGDEEKAYLKDVQRNAVASGIMAGLNGATGILNAGLQGAQIADTSMYDYEIGNILQDSQRKYYDFGQLGQDYARARLGMDEIDHDDIRGMSTGEKIGSVGSGIMSGAMAGRDIGGLPGLIVGSIAGGAGSLAGLAIGDGRAKQRAMEIGNQADIASQFARQNYDAAFEEVSDMKHREQQKNIVAEGGKISNAAKSKHMTVKQFADTVLANSNKEQYMTTMEKRKLSEGGNIYNTHGAYFAPNLLKIDAGGSHEQSPYGGVQVGVDPNGIPNLVEQGEVIYDDYVFSARLKASEKLLKDFALPTKYAGKDFAYIADKLSDEAKERSNDTISNNGMGVMLDRLMAAQDFYKQQQAERKLKNQLKEMSPEELMQLGTALAEVSQEETMPAEGGMPVMAACGGKLVHKYKNGDKLRKFFNNLSDNINTLLKVPTAETIADTPAQVVAPVQTSEPYIVSGEYTGQPNMWQVNAVAGGNYSPFIEQPLGSGETSYVAPQPKTQSGQKRASSGVNVSPQPTSADIELNPDYANFVQMMSDQRDAKGNPSESAMSMLKSMGYTDFNKWLHDATDGNYGPVHAKTWEAAQKWKQTQAARNADALPAIGRPTVLQDPNVIGASLPAKANATPVGISEHPTGTTETTAEGTMPMLPTGLRFAGAGYNILSAFNNMLQEPDEYEYRRFTPQTAYGKLSLDRARYNPIDVNIAQNQINADAAATRRAMLNAGLGPSTGANLAALDYNTGRSLGNAYAQTKLANLEQYNNVINTNNQAEQAEANFDYQRNAYNAGLLNQYGLYNVQNVIQNDYMNKMAETQKWQAVSQAADAAATDLANIGRENMNFNMANSNPALFYGINPWSAGIFYKQNG